MGRFRLFIRRGIAVMYSMWYPSPVGRLLLTCQDGGLTGLWLEGQKYFAAGLSEEPLQEPDRPELRAACKWLDAYFAGRRPSASSLTLIPKGSEFRRIVWTLLCEIPYGTYTTYGELAGRAAARMGRESMSSQAVGGAVGHNPISIIIPCHRVVGANGSPSRAMAADMPPSVIFLRWNLGSRLTSSRSAAA